MLKANDSRLTVNSQKLIVNRQGFTMVELVLVVGVLVILSAVVLVAMKVPQYRGQAHNVQRKTDIDSMHKAFLLMARDKDDYTAGLPTSLTCIGTGSDKFNLSGISWTKSPSDADIKFNIRACPDSTCSTNPSWSQDYGISGAALNISDASFFQYRATFNNIQSLAWTQTTDGEFNSGVSAPVNTAIIDNSIELFLPGIGNGSDGDFDASSYVSGSVIGITKSGTTITIDANNATRQGNYYFKNFTLQNIYTLTATGKTYKINIGARGNVAIDGIINLAGSGTTAIAGGGSGGGYGQSNTPCNAGLSAGQGVGPGSVGGGQTSGGGGGFGATGGASGSGGTPGSSYGDSTLSTLYGGSGGGGGGADCSDDNGGSGGAGGGAITIIAHGNITIGNTGVINVNGAYGGNGGASDTGSWAGGGGAGGGVLLRAGQSLINNGSIRARGGNRGITSNPDFYPTKVGGYGAGGRVRLETLSGSNITTGTIKTASCTGGAGIEVCGGDDTNYFGTATSGSGSGYYNTGTYTSDIKDLGSQAFFSTFSWTTIGSVPGDGEIALDSVNLNGLWHFNENGGASTKDFKGANNGTIAGTGYWASSGKFGAALNTDGDDYTNINDNNALDIGTGDWSAEAWFKLSGGSGTRTILSKDDLYDLKIDNTNHVMAGIYDPNDTDEKIITGDTIISDTTNWHHAVLVFTKSAGKVDLYVDGKLDGAGSISPIALAGDFSNGANLRIGANGSGANIFYGNIDEVSVWSKVLTGPLVNCSTDDPYSTLYDVCRHYNGGFGAPHIKFQARSCSSSCTSEAFVGPDGTANTYYKSTGTYGSGSDLINLPPNQWVQYKAYLYSSDVSQTPVIDSVRVDFFTSSINLPKLEEVAVGASFVSNGADINLIFSSRGDFAGGGTNIGQIIPPNSLSYLDEGAVQYQGGTNSQYISPVISAQCYDLKPLLYPEYLPQIPKDPKIGTDENTGYFFSANSEMGTVTISAPAAELGEIIRN